MVKCKTPGCTNNTHASYKMCRTCTWSFLYGFQTALQQIIDEESILLFVKKKKVLKGGK